MSQAVLFQPQIRKECPPGACKCERELLLDDLSTAAARVLMLNREEEKRLIERIGRIDSFDDLQRVGMLLQRNLGIVLQIVPVAREVRTVRGLQIRLLDQPGLCHKTRQTIPAAIRKRLEEQPTIVYALLDAHDLLGAPADPPSLKKVDDVATPSQSPADTPDLV